MKRTPVVLGAMAGLAAALGVACAAQPEQPPAPGGSTAPAATTPAAAATAARVADPTAQLRMATTTLHASFDPYTTTSPTTARHLDPMYDTFAWGAAGGPTPRLATGWKVLSPTEWEFTLRQGVKFHNGDPLTMEDVVFSFDRLRNDTTLAASRRAADVAEMRVIDPQTIVFVTTTPRPTFIETARQVQILPKNYFERVGPQGFAEAPVGSGPFKLVSWNPGVEFVGERFADYWDGPTQVAGLRLQALPEASTKEAGLRSGSLDMAEFVPIDLAVRLGQDGFDMADDIAGQQNGVFTDTIQPSPIQSRAVRQALNYGTNKDELRNTFLAGRGLSVGQFGMPGIPGWNEAIAPYPYDPARARALLAEGGQPNGFTIKMHASTSGTSINSRDVAQALQAGWARDMRVNVELDFIESALMSQMFTAGGYHPLRLTAQGFGTQLEAIFQFYNSANPYFQRFSSALRYDNPAFTEVFAASEREFDPARRDALLQQANKILHDDAAMIYTALEPTMRVYSPRLNGLFITVGGQYGWNQYVIYRN